MKKHSLKIRTRPSRMVSIRIPEGTLDALKEVAGHKDMGYQALIKFYPPSQKATGVNPWMNARWVPSVALAKEGALRRVPP